MKAKTKKVACIRPWYSTFSYRDTKVCCWQKTSLGTLRDGSSLDSVWNSKVAQEFRRAMFNAPEGKLPEKHCSKLCGGKLAPENALKEYRELAQAGATRVDLPPQEASFVVDHVCNLRCKMCWIFDDPDYGQSAEGLRGILHELHERRGKHPSTVNLLGGEPFFSKKSRALINAVLDDRLDVKLSFITNMTIFDENLLERIGPDRIGYFTVSFDGGTRKTYERIRKNASFEKVVGHIRKLCEYRYRRSRELGEKHWEISIPSIVMSSNFRELERTFDLFKELPVFLLFVPIHRGYRPRSQEQVFDSVPDQLELMERLKGLKRRAEERLASVDEWDYAVPVHARFSEKQRRQKKKEYVIRTIESIDRCIAYLWDILSSRNPNAFNAPEFDVEVTQEGVVKFVEPRKDPGKSEKAL